MVCVAVLLVLEKRYEKPHYCRISAKIKTISKFLGKDYKILSTLGHIKDLPQKEIGVTIGDTIDIHYVTLEGKEKTIADIVKKHKKLIIFTSLPILIEKEKLSHGMSNKRSSVLLKIVQLLNASPLMRLQSLP